MADLKTAQEKALAVVVTVVLERRRSHMERADLQVEQHFHFLHLHFAPVLLMGAVRQTNWKTGKHSAVNWNQKLLLCFVPCCT